LCKGSHTPRDRIDLGRANSIGRHADARQEPDNLCSVVGDLLF
jgi:hypothetical protein